MDTNPDESDRLPSQTGAAAGPTGSIGETNRTERMVKAARPWMVLLFVCSAFSLHPTFRSIFWHQEYLSGIVGQSARNIILAVGMTFVIVTGGIDLSVGSVLALAGVGVGMALTGNPRFPFWLAMLTALPVAGAVALFAYRGAARSSRTAAPAVFIIVFAVLEAGIGYFVFHGIGPGVKVEGALLIGLAIGVACGLINGAIVSGGRVPPFVATLGMMSAARGLTLYATSSRSVSIPFERFRALGAGIPLLSATLIVALCAALFLQRFRAGRYMLSVGGNEQATRLSGVPVAGVKILAYALSGLCAAIGGILISAKFGTANTGAGNNAELEAIAAVVIGGASLSGGKGTIVGAVVGALTITVITNGLVLVGIEPNLQQVILGAVIVLTVFVDQIQQFRK
jgi:ribose/xylose/arabinose/galactoside ABC-type transport system permease subunit